MEHRLDHRYQRTMEIERRKIINKKQSFSQMDVKRSSLLRDVFLVIRCFLLLMSSTTIDGKIKRTRVFSAYFENANSY